MKSIVPYFIKSAYAWAYVSVLSSAKINVYIKALNGMLWTCVCVRAKILNFHFVCAPTYEEGGGG